MEEQEILVSAEAEHVHKYMPSPFMIAHGGFTA
jgi:hypothetical protein